MQFRLSILCCGVAFAAVPVFGQSMAQAADANAFPTRPVRMVVGFTPGGQPDIAARIIGPKLSELWQQQVVVDNRPGAGGTIGTKIVADATPDGHTMLSVSASHVISPSIYTKLPYDTLRDFSAVTMTVAATYVLAVSPSSGLKTLQDLIALAKSRPGQLNFSSAGMGSGTHFAGEMFKQRTGIDVVHVPYKGVPEALTDAMTGRVQFTMAPLGASLNLVRDGRLRGLAVSSAKRVAVHPDLPTIAESGFPGFRWDSWGGLLVPAKTPRATLTKINRDVIRVLGLPDIQQRFAALGMEPTPTTPAEFDKLIAQEMAMVAELARKAGLKPQ